MTVNLLSIWETEFVEIPAILVLFITSSPGQVNISIPESIERLSNDLLHHVATLTMPFGLLYAVMVHDILQQIQVMYNGE